LNNISKKFSASKGLLTATGYFPGPYNIEVKGNIIKRSSMKK
jgi:hypothetical protein